MNQITNFWNHFKQNNFVFLLLNEIPYEVLKIHFDKLIYTLHKYNNNLNLIIKNGENRTELIITANGNPYLFKEVELLVHHAPVIEGWKITAFVQPEQNTIPFEQGTDQPYKFDDISLKVSEMYFKPIKHLDFPYKFGIKIYLKNHIIHKHNPKLQEAVYIVIEHLIGEKHYANTILFIEVEQLFNLNNNPIRLCKLYNLISNYKT